jgi:hypothetical protein
MNSSVRRALASHGAGLIPACQLASARTGHEIRKLDRSRLMQPTDVPEQPDATDGAYPRLQSPRAPEQYPADHVTATAHLAGSPPRMELDPDLLSEEQIAAGWNLVDDLLINTLAQKSRPLPVPLLERLAPLMADVRVRDHLIARCGDVPAWAVARVAGDLARHAIMQHQRCAALCAVAFALAADGRPDAALVAVAAALAQSPKSGLAGLLKLSLMSGQASAWYLETAERTRARMLAQVATLQSGEARASRPARADTP